MEFKDYYAVLGVKPDADDKAIKTAYRKLARQYHPDVSTHAEAENKFKDIAEAYEVLHNAERRAEYDELCEARNSGQAFERPGAGSGHYAQSNQDFADFFNSIFGGAASAGQRRYQNFDADAFRQKGRDVEVELPIFLEETLADTIKPVAYILQYYDQQGQLQESKKSLNVKIPAGVANDERIRVKGQGAPGIGNAESGDLYLHIRLVPHPLFDVEAHNLILTIPLAPWEAALGKKITVPTLSGKIQLTIAPNSQTGQRLRIKGKGLIGKHGAGDLFAVLKVVMPAHTDEEARPLWTQLAAKSGFDPRAEWSK